MVLQMYIFIMEDNSFCHITLNSLIVPVSEEKTVPTLRSLRTCSKSPVFNAPTISRAQLPESFSDCR